MEIEVGIAQNAWRIGMSLIFTLTLMLQTSILGMDHDLLAII